VVVAPPSSDGTTLLLARASSTQQEAFIGNLWDLVEYDPEHPQSVKKTATGVQAK